MISPLKLNRFCGLPCDLAQDLPFPKKRLSTMRRNPRIIEERIVTLEQYTRRVLHILTSHSTMDPLASRSLRHLQNFLGSWSVVHCVYSEGTLESYLV